MSKGQPFLTKKEFILDYLNEQKRAFTQNELAIKFYEHLSYTNSISARVSIGQMLLDLQKEGKVSFVEEKPKKGSISTKKWYANGVI